MAFRAYPRGALLALVVVLAAHADPDKNTESQASASAPVQRAAEGLTPLDSEAMANARVQSNLPAGVATVPDEQTIEEQQRFLPQGDLPAPELPLPVIPQTDGLTPEQEAFRDALIQQSGAL